MKKKAVAATWAFAVGLVVIFTTFHIAEANNAPLLDRSLSLAGLASQLKTPDNIAKYLWRHFQFEQDQRQFGQKEYWQQPEEFLKNGKGDCEDFSIFARELLRLNGLNSFLMSIYSNGTGHTICVFEENGEYNVIDGTTVKYLHAHSLNEVAQQINPFWKTGALVRFSPASHQGFILKEFAR